jgi:hypothetical protein
VLEDHSAVEEGHDCEAAAKNERTGVGEEGRDLEEEPRLGG